ncbi:MAG: DUF2887 domain-containing protein [Nodosilinea sp.]
MLVPLSDDPTIPGICLESQMQPDSRFYGRYAKTYLCLYQYQVERPWCGLLVAPTIPEQRSCLQPTINGSRAEPGHLYNGRE